VRYSGKPLAQWRTWIAGIALLVPALILAILGLVELRNGSVIDAAYPVPDYLSTDHALPKALYAFGAGLLADADARSGNAQISRAEAMFYAAHNPPLARPVMEEGLEKAPASAEGWVYYARILAPSEPRKADLALDQAFTLAPNDYFLAPMRAQLAAQIWPYLSDRTKNEALRQARALWSEPILRGGLIPFLTTSDGTRLLTRAYATDPAHIRAINRWIHAQQRNPAQGP
jgi:hypothetical protein